nr:hypothetical protein [Tanacetum cinerariifolium]
AHYDVCGEQPGADDNASAVAGLLETARLLQSQAATLRHRIDFVAYSLEEPPFFGTEYMGSAVHAQSLHDAGARVRAMLCYEMIGYFSDEPGSQQFPDAALAARYPSTGNFIIVREGAVEQGRLAAGGYFIGKPRQRGIEQVRSFAGVHRQPDGGRNSVHGRKLGEGPGVAHDAGHAHYPLLG